LLATTIPATAGSQDRLPIIDMHLHSYDEANYFVVPDEYGQMSPPTADAHFEATYEIMRRHQIVLGVISNSASSEDAWLAKDKDKRFLRGFGSFGQDDWTPKSFEQLVKDGKIDVFGEIGAYYDGRTLADPYYDPYLKICEEYGIPVALHTGGGASRDYLSRISKGAPVIGKPFAHRGRPREVSEVENLFDAFGRELLSGSIASYVVLPTSLFRSGSRVMGTRLA